MLKIYLDWNIITKLKFGKEISRAPRVGLEHFKSHGGQHAVAFLGRIDVAAEIVMELEVLGLDYGHSEKAECG